MKLCKDCKFYENFRLDKSLSYCRNPKSNDYSIDPVTGKQKYAFCKHEREDKNISSICGPDGKFFEPKKSIWQRFLEWRNE